MSVAAAIAAFTGFAVPHLVHWLIGEVNKYIHTNDKNPINITVISLI